MRPLLTSAQWWASVKDDLDRFVDWLKSQYHGEITAHQRILEFAARYLPADSRWARVLEKIAAQELTHAAWVGKLLLSRGITPEVLAKDERYWSKTLPAIESLQSGAAVAAHAEGMRLERIRVIADDPSAPQDVRSVFARILPEEEFHERAFRTLAGGEAMKAALANHLAGRQAIGLIPDGFAHV